MAIFLNAGSFRVTGAQPDGDSIRFTPDDPTKWDLITGPNKVKRNHSGAAQLRPPVAFPGYVGRLVETFAGPA
jgi:hypothetical protein